MPSKPRIIKFIDLINRMRSFDTSIMNRPSLGNTIAMLESCDRYKGTFICATQVEKEAATAVLSTECLIMTLNDLEKHYFLGRKLHKPLFIDPQVVELCAQEVLAIYEQIPFTDNGDITKRLLGDFIDINHLKIELEMALTENKRLHEEVASLKQSLSKSQG